MNKKFTLLLSVLFFVSGSMYGQLIKSFTQRTSQYTPNTKIYNLKGDFQMIGNTNLTLAAYSNNASNNGNMKYVDIDNDETTLNSSSATLQFSNEQGAKPKCSRVVYAGLYWTGRAHNNEASPMYFTVRKNGEDITLDKRKVRLKHANGDYLNVEAQDNHIYFPTNAHGNMYSAYAEVTDYVRTHGAGEYTVADIALREGNGGGTGFFGGWGMIVIYENSKMKWRDITVFDGHAYIMSPNPGVVNIDYELPISGFRTAQSGAVNLKLGLIAGEGDRNIPGDYFEILKQGTSNNWIKLKHTNNSTNNFFNGSIPATNPRNPNLLNNTGIDITMFNINNVNNSLIANNQTSTKFKYGSRQDTYIIPCIAMAVDAYVPDVEGHVEITTTGGNPYTGGQVLPSGEVEYELTLANPSQERILDVSIDIPVPYTAELVSYSATYSSEITTGQQPQEIDVSGAKLLRWNIGTLPVSQTSNLAKLKFKLKATTNCFLLVYEECRPKILLEGKISGKGELSGRSFSDLRFIRGYQDGECQDEPIYSPLAIDIDAQDFVNNNCADMPEGTSLSKPFVYCEDPGVDVFKAISKIFPPGTRFYSQIVIETQDNVQIVKPASGATEYTAATNFPTSYSNIGETLYHAVPFGASACKWDFRIKIKPCCYWIGASTSDWNTISNWSKNRIPSTNEDIIFSTVANNGRIAEKDLVLDNNRTIGKLINETSFATVIPAGKSLVVVDTISGSETIDKANKIKIQAQNGQPNGTLIIKGQPASKPVYATVQMYSQAYKSATAETWTDNIPGSPTSGQNFASTYRWQYFGIPVEEVVAESVFYGAFVREYDEAYNGEKNERFFNKWKTVKNNQKMTAFKGYEITANDPRTYNIRGKLYLNDKQLILTRKAPAITTYTGTDVKLKHWGLGQNIFGNSYTAAININQINFPQGVEQSVYFYNTGSIKNWGDNNGGAVSQTETFAPGSYFCVPKNVASIVWDNRIPSMQGFLLKFKESEMTPNGTDATVTLNYSSVGVSNNTQPQKAPANTGVTGYLKVLLSSKRTTDVMWLIETPDATDGFDNGYDGYKLSSRASSGIIFTETQDGDFQVSSSNSIVYKPFSFRSNNDTIYTLTIVKSDLDNYADLRLLDLKTNIYTPVKTDTTIYHFTSEAKGDIEKRFMFVDANNTTTDIESNPSIDLLDVYLEGDNMLVVNNMTSSAGSMTLFDIAGAKIATSRVQQGISKIPVQLAAGVYMVDIKASKRKKTFKIIIGGE